MQDNLGDRMKKNYEWRNQPFLTRRIPVIIRVDGKSFHTYTKKFDKPFDQFLIDAMVSSAKQVAQEMQGFKVAYIQSDEASFVLTDYDRLSTQAWFDYRQQKLVSVTASMMTAFFNEEMSGISTSVSNLAFFDARAWNIPKEDVANYLLWRAKDWERNSLSMYCRSFFSHKELNGKTKEERHNMLNSINKDWYNDLPSQQKNGTFLLLSNGEIETNTQIGPTYQQVSEVVNSLLQPLDIEV